MKFRFTVFVWPSALIGCFKPDPLPRLNQECVMVLPLSLYHYLKNDPYFQLKAVFL